MSAPSVVAAWPASTGPKVTAYNLFWVVNGVKATTPVKVPRTAALDAAGYTLDYDTSTGKTPSDGDQIGATVIALDETDSLQSVELASTPLFVTIPISPPPAPASLTVTLTPAS